MVTGGNGRTVYCGRVGNLSAAGFTLSGVEYDPEIDAEVSVVLELRFDAELPENAKKIKDGDMVAVTVMPSRNDMRKGTAEEIIHSGGIISIRNDRGNEKVVVVAQPRRIAWNEKHTALKVSFTNLKNPEGQLVGVMGKPFTDYLGHTRTTCWLTSTYFAAKPDSQIRNRWTAERFETEVKTGDTIALVMSVKESDYNGTHYTNYNGAKFMVVQRAQETGTQGGAQAQSAQSQTQTAEQPQATAQPYQAPVQPQQAAQMPVQPQQGYPAYQQPAQPRTPYQAPQVPQTAAPYPAAPAQQAAADEGLPWADPAASMPGSVIPAATPSQSVPDFSTKASDEEFDDILA